MQEKNQPENKIEPWKSHWIEVGENWRQEPEISEERKKFLLLQLHNTEEDKFSPFFRVILTRADIEWLLSTHESDGIVGPVDWFDEKHNHREGLDLRGAILDQLNLDNLPLAKVRAGLPFETWSMIDYGIRNLLRTRMEGTSFNSTLLQGANLNFVDAAYSDFSNARLEDSEILGANLQSTRFNEAILIGADVRLSNLNNSILNGCNFQRGNYAGTTFKQAKLSNCNLILTNGSEADFQFAYLAGSNLTGAVLYNANLAGANLVRSYIAGTNFTQAYMVGTDMTEANSRNAIYSHAKLNGAICVSVDFTDANFEGADLRGANFTGATLDSEIESQINKANIGGSNVLGIRLINEPLDNVVVSSLLSSLQKLITSCRLISEHRYIELVEYAQTHDRRFEKDTKVTILQISYNSPLELKLGLGQEAKDMVQAVSMAIDTITTAKSRARIAEAEVDIKYVEIQAKQIEVEQKKQQLRDGKKKSILAIQREQLELARLEIQIEKEKLELERQRLIIQRETLELEQQKRGYAIEIASMMIDRLNPEASQEAKLMMAQLLIPQIFQIGEIEGLQIVLPATLENS